MRSNTSLISTGRILSIILVLLFNFHCFAEGTKQIRPTSGDVGNIEINDMGRPFALESNTDTLHRLYFHISSTTEKVYFGFNHVGAGTATFRIKNPSGTVVYARTTVPTSGTGFISTYDQAVAGPKVGGVPATGYTPFSFTPATTGDFYIEFTTSLSGTYHFDLFDLTVKNAAGATIEGRLWSYAWDLSLRTFDGRLNGTFYVYTQDHYVSKVNMNGIQPFGFELACNGSGPGNSSSGDNANRKSVEGNSTRPQFKIFLNNPDITAYPSGAIPTIVENLGVAGAINYGEPINFTLNMSQPGSVQIILDINGIAGYQPNTQDVILVRNVRAGKDTIVWDAKDGFGDYVNSSARVSVSSGFASGTTHLPLYDPETHERGYLVERVRPATGSCMLYWDDSNFTDGTTNIDGTLTNGHSWPYYFGNVRTMNTWWNGYELAVLNTFDFSINFTLPISLLEFKATPFGDEIEISWKTASEINNDFFLIERSSDGKNFSPIWNIRGAGNTSTEKSYSIIDDNPDKGINYYRLLQSDFDGTQTMAGITYASLEASPQKTNIFPNPINTSTPIKINIPENKEEEISVNILNNSGQVVFNETYTDNPKAINIPPIKSQGIYIIELKTGSTINKSILIVE